MSKEQFLKNFDSNPAQLPIQVKARAIIQNGLDFPTSRDEHWKYTRVAPIIDSLYCNNSFNKKEAQAKLSKLGITPNIVYVNGSYNVELSQTLPYGVTINTLTNSGDSKLGQIAPFEKDAFNALNTAYFVNGASIKVSENASIEEPICILHLTIGESQASNPRLLIEVEPNAQVKFVHQFEAPHSNGSFTNSLAEIWVGDGAQVSYNLVENEGETSKLVNSTMVSQGRNSKFTSVTVTKSGKLVRNNLSIAMTAQGCEANMYGIYFTSGQQHIDNHTFVDHQMPDCNSNELYKGVMTDRSTGVFNGKIMVRKDAQKTNGYQSNQNVLLSDTATINSKPELEIYADDVKCSHGCTVGQLDEEAMFYLRSRGLGIEDAHRLLVKAFAADVIEKIGPDNLRNNIEEFIASKFSKT